MKMLRTSLLSGISNVLRILLGLVLNKVYAVYVGPAGIALLGQFQNLTGIASGLCTGGITSGVVKYTAEVRHDPEQRSRLFSTALVFGFTLTVPTSLLLIVLRHQLSAALLHSDQFAGLIAIFGLTVAFMFIASLLGAVLNGYMEVERLLMANLAGSLLSLPLAYWLVTRYQVYGALLVATLAPLVSLSVTGLAVVGLPWFRARDFFQRPDRQYAVRLGKYSVMTMVTIATFPVSQILIRNYLISHFSATGAGYWQGVTRISDNYLALVTTTLAVYYLPRLSEIQDARVLREEILHGYKLILPMVAGIALAIYLLRDFIIRVLFTAAFLPMKPLFAFQLIGDVLKIASWLLAYIMVAKAMTRYFIVTEIIFTASLLLLTLGFVRFYGLVGVTYAFAFNYLAYLALMVWKFRGLLLGRGLPW